MYSIIDHDIYLKGGRHEYRGMCHQDGKRSQDSEVIIKLADEERRHLKVVENIYSFVEDPRTYLEWVEFGNREL